MKAAGTTLNALLLAVTLSACSLIEGKPIKRVGSYTITQKDLDYRGRVSKIFYPEEQRLDVALLQLSNAFLIAEILKNNGHAIDDQVLLAEENRINSSTKDPATLTKIKEIFGKDHESYLKNFILPTYAERVVYYEFFLKNENLQEPTRQVAAQFFEKAKAEPGRFLEIAENEKLAHSVVEVSEKDGLVWGGKRSHGKHAGLVNESPEAREQKKMTEELAAQARDHSIQEAKRWIADLLMPTPKGQVVNHIIDDQERWLVLRNQGGDIKKRVFRVDVVFFPKLSYSQWLETEKLKVKIENR